MHTMGPLFKVIDLTHANVLLTEEAERARQDYKDTRGLLDDIQSQRQNLELSLTNEQFARTKADSDVSKLQVTFSSRLFPIYLPMLGRD